MGRLGLGVGLNNRSFGASGGTPTPTPSDTTAPTLSSPTGTQTGSTTGTSTVSTNEANGTLYSFLSTSSTPPSAANLKTGTGAVTSASQAVTGTGVQTVNWTGLTASTLYYTHWLHRDAAGNDSAIVSGAGFTTSASAYITIPNYATIAAFGDSVTFGQGASVTANNWASLLATSLSATLLNSGVSGSVLQNSPDSTASPRANNGRDRFTADVLGTNKKAAIFVAYGYNDGRYTGAPATFNVTQYQNDLREVINGLIIGGYARDDIYLAPPYYITDTGLATGSAGFTGQTRIGFAAFATAAAAVAAEYGTRYCDLYAELNNATWIADVDSSDHIHPTDVGYALIKSAWTNRTIAANTAAYPATVSASAVGTTVTVTASATTGAASYEYALISNSVDVSSNTSGVFTGVADGTYRARARAVFSGGSKGPWAFATLNVTVAAVTVFVSDTFTGTDGTALTAHSPDTGGSWVAQTGFASTTPPAINSNRLMAQDFNNVYNNTATPPSADYYVEADLVWRSSLTGDSVAVAGRMSATGTTLYWFGYARGSTGFRLFKTVGGTNTQLGTTQTDAFASGTKKIRLTMNGSTISGSVDGVTLISVTDSAITAAGRAGLRIPVVQSATTGLHIDNFVASV